MLIKKLKTYEEIREFASVYQTLSKNPVENLDYLMNAHIRAFYVKGELMAGYAVSSFSLNGKLRYFDFLSENQKNDVLKKGVKQHQVAEITYTFIKSRKLNYLQNSLVLILSVFDAMVLGKKYIIGGGIIKSFNNRMKKVLNQVWFDGEVAVFGQTKNFTLLGDTSLNVLFNFPKAYLLELFSRMK